MSEIKYPKIEWISKGPLTELKPVSANELKKESGWELSDSAAVKIDSDGVIWDIRSDSHLFPKTIENTITCYIGDEIERFCYENHITKKAWNKRGVIELDTKELGYFSYFLVYETRFKKRYHKIKFSNLVLKQER